MEYPGQRRTSVARSPEHLLNDTLDFMSDGEWDTDDFLVASSSSKRITTDSDDADTFHLPSDDEWDSYDIPYAGIQSTGSRTHEHEQKSSNGNYQIEQIGYAYLVGAEIIWYLLSVAALAEQQSVTPERIRSHDNEDTDSNDSHIPCGQQIEPEEDSHRTTDENHEQSRQQDRQSEPDHWLNDGSFVDGSEDSNSSNSNRQHREGHWFGSTDGDRSYWAFKYSETRVVHREWYSCYCRSSSNDSSTSTSNSTCGNNSNATIERTNMHGELDRKWFREVAECYYLITGQLTQGKPKILIMPLANGTVVRVVRNGRFSFGRVLIHIGRTGKKVCK
ncbi:uncharacterized protein LOC133391935 isoform X2 [Anopheles gambiae]|uniref:uncharacterized protein LOC133391935 isoform X2 n=1 Tax=Anopheles gambiae TaxID=7165 RepID=UPI002AC8D75D|nr:uncharacterized protein LOC133391935 isoform X2 [Anopheles gambiae]